MNEVIEVTLMNLKKRTGKNWFYCCLCEGIFQGIGNDPFPVRKGGTDECCNACNLKYVIPARLEMIKDQKPHGEWITTYNIWADDDLSAWGHYKECSCCQNQEKFRTPFCPNCGADMRKEGEEK